VASAPLAAAAAAVRTGRATLPPRCQWTQRRDVGRRGAPGTKPHM
jgi:hypothetical protein